jgi:hypothetical protein
MKGVEAMNHHRPFRVGRLALLTMPLLVAVAAPVRAQDAVTTSHIYSITGANTYVPPTPCPCFSPAPSDAVTLSGAIHVLTRVTPGPTGVVEIHANLLDVVGTGATGCPYHAVGAARLSSNTPGPVFFTGTYELIAPPSCPHTPIPVNGEVFINLDGTQNPMLSFFTFSPT